MKITFLGAARNVTGSRFLIEANGAKILVDCGLYQERDYLERNWDPLPVAPFAVDAVVLTHAHLDHCGWLPRLVKDGFKGTIHATPPTAEIAAIAMKDAGSLQEEDAAFKQKRHREENRTGSHPVVPLYTMEDAVIAASYFSPLAYGEPRTIADGIVLTFRDAGHILGSSSVRLEITGGEGKKTLVFSGDVGRWDRPLLCDPSLFSQADTVFVESTYGDRIHEERTVSLERFTRIIRETCEKGGKTLIPTFAIERAQEVLYYLAKMIREQTIPRVPVFLDSPMAINVTEVFKKYPDYCDAETKNLLERGERLFDFPGLQLTKTVEESKAAHAQEGPAVILAGSGMCTGGRIKHHLSTGIARPENTVLFVGYQAQGTLGREILERPSSVRIFGGIVPVSARIEKINGFSGHADREELLRWLAGFTPPPGNIFVIHGEAEVAEKFAKTVKNQFPGTETVVPVYLASVDI